MIEEFERHLRGTNLSENTVTSYLFAVRQFGERHEAITKRNLKEHKAWLIEQYKPKTVNLRIRAINCYLESIGKDSWKLSSIRVQGMQCRCTDPKSFLQTDAGKSGDKPPQDQCHTLTPASSAVKKYLLW